MAKSEFSLREKFFARVKQRPKCVHKKWVDFPTGARALITDFTIVLQLTLLAFLYAFFAYIFQIFFYISVGLTVITGGYVLVCERDIQTKSSWLFLFLVSFGCGYIVYFLADKRVCYGHDRKRFDKILERSRLYTGAYVLEGAETVVSNDCEYIYNAGGFIPYTGTDIKY